MATPEVRVKTAAAKIFARYGIYTFKPVTGGYGVSGLFDEVACIDGVFVGIEYKATSKLKPTVLQSINAQKCMDSGGLALYIHKDNVQYLEAVILAIKNRYTEPGCRGLWDNLSNWEGTAIPEVAL